MTWRIQGLRGTPARIARPGCDIVSQARKSVEMSLDAADTSVRATYPWASAILRRVCVASDYTILYATAYFNHFKYSGSECN
jgi:hypothetical protein